MTDETAAALAARTPNWKDEHLQSYLASGGTAGHILDMAFLGGYDFTPNCLIRYVGRKSGKVFVTPLIYGIIAGEVILVASKGGADHHPAWYLNIAAGDDVSLQIGTQAFTGTWRELDDTEYDRAWQHMVDVYPPYAEYKAATERRIPVIALKAAQSVPVFTAVDMA